ncbi:MAG: hypothetical protein ABF651_05935 [Sporolactobacillus sp.]
MAKFFLDLLQIRPSQLYLDAAKIERLKQSFDPLNIRNNAPLPVRKIGGEVFLTDGHTRAYLYDQARISLIPVYWDENDLNDALYTRCLDWCRKEQIIFISDLRERILSPAEYQKLWVNRCEEEERRLEQ